MKTRCWSAVVLVLTFVMGAARLSAQPVYRCGNSYSQVPCPGAVVVDVDDPRTPQQRAQTDAAARQAAASAAQMEKQRLALERTRPVGGPRPAARDGERTTGKGTKAEHKPEPKTKNKNSPEYFTAAARTEDKKSVAAADKPTPSPAKP